MISRGELTDEAWARTSWTTRSELQEPVEEASGEVRVVSTGERKEFRKCDGRAEQFVELLRSMGEIPADQEPILREVLAAIKEFRVAEVHIPAGTQVLRFHARQILRPVGGDTRSYEVEFFAPLAGFVLAPSGQAQMSVTVAFPPAWAAPGISIGTPVITPLPGQVAPPEQPSGPTPIAERPIYGWLWGSDPKVTIAYRYG